MANHAVSRAIKTVVKDVSDRAGRVRVKAEKKLGDKLAEFPKAKGAAAGGKKDGPRGTYSEPRDKAPTLADIGIDFKRSAQAQKLAEIPQQRRAPPERTHQGAETCKQAPRRPSTS